MGAVVLISPPPLSKKSRAMGKKEPKKRKWRKNNLEDVEEALEDERLVNKIAKKTRLGKTSVADEVGDALFTEDTKGSGDGLNVRTRRELARAKIFPPKAPKLDMSATEELKVARAESQLQAARAGSAKGPKKQEPDVFDLWGSPATKPPSAAQQAFPGIRMQALTKPSKAPQTLHQKVGIAPAVLPAHEGQSMNPEASAFEDVACMAAAKQLEKEHELEAQDRKMHPVSHQLRDVAGNEAFRNMDEESRMALFKKLSYQRAGGAVDEDPGPEDGDGTVAVIRRMSALKKKSQAVRNSKKKQKHLDGLQKQRQERTALEKSVGQVGSLLKELKEVDELHGKRRKYKQELRAKRAAEEKEGVSVPKKGHRLGRNAFQEEEVLVPDSGAVGASKGLRAMPLQSCAVRERLSSIMRRGLLPPPADHAAKGEAGRVKRRNARVKNGRRFVSPLLRDNLMLR